MQLSGFKVLLPIIHF